MKISISEALNYFIYTFLIITGNGGSNEGNSGSNNNGWSNGGWDNGGSVGYTGDSGHGHDGYHFHIFTHTSMKFNNFIYYLIFYSQEIHCN